MTQDELAAKLSEVNVEMDDDLAKLAQIAKEAVFVKAHLITGLQAILDILNSTVPDQAVTLEMVPGTPREQPKP